MRAEVLAPATLPSRQTLAALAAFISSQMGLHFPASRLADLQRGLAAAAHDRGFTDSASFADALLSCEFTSADLHALAQHLTIGETYFFREGATLDVLSQRILPELIEQRRGRRDYSLRLWSAACSSGEEAYTLAILLRQLLPDWKDWRITLLATDINGRALARARDGVYGEWSFRTMPPLLRERYFMRLSKNHFSVRPEIRERVTFCQLNLAAPSPSVDTRAMDIVLCRNVLMYFAPEQAQQVVQTLHDSLMDGGWLAVSPSECSQTLFSRFKVVNFPDAILYRKDAPAQKPAPLIEPARLQPPPPRPKPLLPERTPAKIAQRARELANQGDLAEAVKWSERWTVADKTEPAAHYLHASVLEGMGKHSAARRAFLSSLYLQPDFALAHFALGNLERREQRPALARRHFENAQRLLRTRSADEILPEGDGLTVGVLLAILTSLLSPQPNESHGS